MTYRKVSMTANCKIAICHLFQLKVYFKRMATSQKQKQKLLILLKLEDMVGICCSAELQTGLNKFCKQRRGWI